jgi:hypothetical protein
MFVYFWKRPCMVVFLVIPVRQKGGFVVVHRDNQT